MKVQITLQVNHQSPHLIGKLVDLDRAIRYHQSEIAPHYDQMEAWERKEYQGILSDKKAEFQQSRKIMIDNQSIFNLELQNYNLSVVTFLAVFDNWSE